MIPAPFMRALGSRNYGTGNVYEMRTYTYAPGDLPKVLEAWAKAVPGREELSLLAACWTSELGGLNKFVQHLGVQRSRRARPRPCRIPRARPCVAAAERGTADPAGKQAANPDGLLARAIVGLAWPAPPEGGVIRLPQPARVQRWWKQWIDRRRKPDASSRKARHGIPDCYYPAGAWQGRRSLRPGHIAGGCF